MSEGFPEEEEADFVRIPELEDYFAHDCSDFEIDSDSEHNYETIRAKKVYNCHQC